MVKLVWIYSLVIRASNTLNYPACFQPEHVLKAPEHVLVVSEHVLNAQEHVLVVSEHVLKIPEHVLVVSEHVLKAPEHVLNGPEHVLKAFRAQRGISGPWSDFKQAIVP